MTDKTKLALGCGDRYRGKEYVHLDFVDLPNVDVIHDLEKGTLPFDKNSFNHVEAVHILEHIRKPALIELLKHVALVTKPGGSVRIVMPHFLNMNSWDIDHHRGASRKSFVQFCEGYDMNTPYPTLFREESINYRFAPGALHRVCSLVFPDAWVARFLPNAVGEIEFNLTVLD